MIPARTWIQRKMRLRNSLTVFCPFVDFRFLARTLARRDRRVEEDLCLWEGALPLSVDAPTLREIPSRVRAGGAILAAAAPAPPTTPPVPRLLADQHSPRRAAAPVLVA